MKKILGFLLCWALFAIHSPLLFSQTASPPAVGFTGGVVGSSEATMATTFTNNTLATLASLTGTLGGTNSGDFAVSTSPSNNCGGSLTAGSTCTITFTFTPGAVGGRSATYTLAWTGGSLIIPLYGSGLAQGLSGTVSPIGNYIGTTAVNITTTSYTYLGGPILVPANSANYQNRRIRVHGSGLFTLAATSVLNVEISFCQVSGCASGTVVTPAGAVFTTASDANTASNQQWGIDETFTTSGLDSGSGGTFMAKGTACINVSGTAAANASSCFQDVSTAVSAAIVLTANEYIQVAFKFSTSNSGNYATLSDLSVEFVN